MRRVQVDVQKRVSAWAPGRSEVAAWASAALGRRAAGREIAVRIVGPSESRRLNAQYRGKDKPTNVLSFPVEAVSSAARGDAGRRAGTRSGSPVNGLPELAVAPRPLGDLVICPQVLRTEAREQKKTLRAHWAHLIVHGALHLIGYDHELDADAQRMERREIAVLRRLGFANPYRSAS